MDSLRAALRYGTFPLLALGAGGAVILLIGTNAPAWQPIAVFLLAILGMLAVERLIPYNAAWNDSHGDIGRDVMHFVVNSALNHAGLLLLPALASVAPFAERWPHAWPFWLQVLASLLVLDLGIAAAHHASHRWNGLWRFHAVHHSVKRLYGFNGLMKHPVHQAIETASGVLPLLFFGIPADVASAVTLCVGIQLLLQHSNADYRTGPFKYLFAIAEVHRFHHRKDAATGDVNFGLVTTLYDHLAGTFFFLPGGAPRHSSELGVAGEANYPRGYLAQLMAPFHSSRGQEVGQGAAGL